MGRYGRGSARKLDTCVDGLKRVFISVVKAFDNSILGGARTPKDQEANVANGASKTLKSKHVVIGDGHEYDKATFEAKFGKIRTLSDALDSSPYPIIWPKQEVIDRVHAQINNDAELKKYIKDLARFYAFGGFVKGVAHEQGVKIRWGGDWDGDWDFTDQTFDDLVHFETKED